MSQDSPAAILYDNLGNPVGVIKDGYIYRLQVEAKLVPDENSILAADKAVFGSGVTANRLNQLSANFSGTDTTDQFNNDIGQFVSGSGAIIMTSGLVSILAGTAATAQAKLFTNTTLQYYPGRELYVQFTAGFTTPTDVNSEQRSGIFDGYNGLFIGYHGTTFGVTVRNLSVDTFIPRSSFNGDRLDGSANSTFTRNGVPEAINFNFENVYRIRIGWLGAAPIFFEVMAPDGQWVIYHIIRQPNSSTGPSISDTDLPITFEVTKSGSDATDIKIITSSWDGGVVDSPSSPFKVFPTFSEKDSTTTPLAANATFAGGVRDVSGFVSIDVTVLPDVVSAAGGLLFEFSQDGITFNYSEKFTILGGVGAFYSLAPRAKYFRLSYTNGATDQTSFALTTVFYSVQRSVYIQNLDTDVPSQKGIEVIRSVIAAQKQGGVNNTYTNLQATTGGVLKVSLDTQVIPPLIPTVLVQAGNIGPGSGTLFSDTFASNTVRGNALIVLVLQGQGTFGATYNVSDSQGNVYTKGGTVEDSGIGQIDLWFAISQGGPCTFTAANFSQPSTVVIQHYELSGVAGSILDNLQINIDTGTSLSTGSIFSNNNSQFIISAFVASGMVSITPGIGWTSDLSVPSFECESQLHNLIAPITGPVTGTAIAASSVTYVALIASFLPHLSSAQLVTNTLGQLITSTEITDGTNGPVAVKAPNTAAVAADKALVVAISPNSTQHVVVDGYVYLGTDPVINIGTVNQGSPNTLDNGWPVKITDGYNVLGTVSSPFQVNIDGYVQTNPNVIVVGTTAAGSGASSGLITVQGNASGTPIPVSGILTTDIDGYATTAAPSYVNNTFNPLSLTTSGALRIDGSATTQPVSGTVTANIGTTNGLALDTSVNGILVAQSSTTSGEKGPLVQGAVTTTAPTYVTGNTNPLSLTTAGALRVDGSGVTQPVSGTVTANAGTGTFTVGGTVTSNQGAPNSIANSWPVEMTDGYNILGTTTHPVNVSASIIDAANDAFARLRVSEPYTVFDSKQLVDSAPLFWDDQQTSGSGTTSTFQANQASTLISVSASTAGTRVRQTFRRFNYQPGKGQLITMTGVLGAGTAGVIRRVGYFDGYNGLFFELNGTTMNVATRTDTSGSPVDTSVPQSSWNLDKFDGTGPSGITLDTSKAQIFVIDFQWLGVGRVRFGFFNTGKIFYCHQVLHENANNMVYMSTPNLPLRYEISNTGTGAAASLVHICSAVMSEGGRENTGFTLSTDNNDTTLTTLNNGNNYVLIAIRLGSDKGHATINPVAATVLCTSTSAYRFFLVLNPTVVGTALSFAPVTNSAVEVASPTNTTTVTGGTIIYSAYDQSTSGTKSQISLSVDNALTLGQNIAGVSDILCLCIQRVTGTTESFLGSVSWRETI